MVTLLSTVGSFVTGVILEEIGKIVDVVEPIIAGRNRTDPCIVTKLGGTLKSFPHAIYKTFYYFFNTRINHEDVKNAVMEGSREATRELVGAVRNEYAPHVAALTASVVTLQTRSVVALQRVSNLHLDSQREQQMLVKDTVLVAMSQSLTAHNDLLNRVQESVSVVLSDNQMIREQNQMIQNSVDTLINGGVACNNLDETETISTRHRMLAFQFEISSGIDLIGSEVSALFSQYGQTDTNTAEALQSLGQKLQGYGHLSAMYNDIGASVSRLIAEQPQIAEASIQGVDPSSSAANLAIFTPFCSKKNRFGEIKYVIPFLFLPKMAYGMEHSSHAAGGRDYNLDDRIDTVFEIPTSCASARNRSYKSKS